MCPPSVLVCFALGIVWIQFAFQVGDVGLGCFAFYQCLSGRLAVVYASGLSLKLLIWLTCVSLGGVFGGAKQGRRQIGNNFSSIFCQLGACFFISNTIVVRLIVDCTIARCGPFV